MNSHSKQYRILLIAGSCATNDYKPRQVRKEATAVIPFVCRGGAWLSTNYYRGGGKRSKVRGERKPGNPSSSNLKPQTSNNQNNVLSCLSQEDEAAGLRRSHWSAAHHTNSPECYFSEQGCACLSVHRSQRRWKDIYGSNSCEGLEL